MEGRWGGDPRAVRTTTMEDPLDVTSKGGVALPPELWVEILEHVYAEDLAVVKIDIESLELASRSAVWATLALIHFGNIHIFRQH